MVTLMESSSKLNTGTQYFPVLLKLQDGIVKGGKSLFLVVGRNPLRSNNSGDEKSLMDIDAAADGINDFQATASSQVK
jgi:hypothetical protein